MEHNNRIKILFAESGSLFGHSGFTQQFLMEVKSLKKEGVNVRVIAFESLRDIIGRKSDMYRKILRKNRVRYFIIPSWFRQSPIIRIVFDAINTVILGFIAVLTGSKIVHAHDRLSAYYAIRLKTLLNLKAIYDIHGVGIEELIYKKWLKEGSALHNQLNQMEKEIVRKADAILCVSVKMKEYIVSKYSVPASKIVVTPTNVDTDIFLYSEEGKRRALERLSLHDKVVALFMGHFNRWQVNGLFGVLFKSFKEKVENVHFLIMTDHKEVFEDMFRNIGINETDYSIYSASHEEVPDYASAGDVGILLRDDSIVNRVSAPAKFGEYLALGMPVIITKGIGDTEEIVRKNHVGSVIDGSDPDSPSRAVDEILSMIRNGGGKLSEHCNRIANATLSVAASAEAFINIYRKVLTETHIQ